MTPTIRRELICLFDGACEPRNPGGHATCGIYIEGDGIRYAYAHYLCQGEKATNNYAEWCALGKALKWCVENVAEIRAFGVTHISFKGDSKLVVEQFSGTWRCNAETLKPLQGRCHDLANVLRIDGFAVTCSWIPREQNEKADALSRQAYEEHTGQKFPERRR